MDPHEIIREAETLEKDWQALAARLEVHRKRMEALRERPVLEGDAVAAVWHEALSAIADDTARLEADAARLTERSEQLRQRKPRMADLPGFAGFVGRRHWAWGAAVGFVLAMFGAILLGWSYADTGGGARLTYFEIAAQVLPVLVLAIAVEGRQFDLASVAPPAVKAFHVVGLMWLAAGEVAAFVVIADGRESALAYALTTAALYNSGLLMVTMAIVGRSVVEEPPR